MSTSIKFNFLNEYKNNQKQFFDNNIIEQFRGYHIANNNLTVDQYKYWNTTEKFSSNNTVLLDTNIINQKQYFKSNLLLQYIGYYLAKEKISSLEVIQTTQFKLNLITDTNISDNFNNIISDAINIIEDIVITYNPSEIQTQSSEIKVTEYPRTDDILGSAYPHRSPREIEINTGYSLPDYINCYLHVDGVKSSYDILTVTLIHELIHMLGLGIHNSWYDSLFESNNNSNNLFYTGTKGLENYLNILSNNNLSTTGIIGIPIENNFGYGSVDVHFEEGQNNDYNAESRYHNNILHPTIPGELMTPYINISIYQYDCNYISILTLGILNDMGYTVNYESKYVTQSENLDIQS